MPLCWLYWSFQQFVISTKALLCPCCAPKWPKNLLMQDDCIQCSVKKMTLLVDKLTISNRKCNKQFFQTIFTSFCLFVSIYLHPFSVTLLRCSQSCYRQVGITILQRYAKMSPQIYAEKGVVYRNSQISTMRCAAFYIKGGDWFWFPVWCLACLSGFYPDFDIMETATQIPQNDTISYLQPKKPFQPSSSSKIWLIFFFTAVSSFLISVVALWDNSVHQHHIQKSSILSILHLVTFPV